MSNFFKLLAQWCYFYTESELAGGFYFEAVTKNNLYLSFTNF